MSDGLELLLFLILGVGFFGWFVWGTQWNVRKGNASLKWLRQGLPLVGERTTMQWIGSSAIVLKIAKANAPFRSAETFVALEPRDVVFLWAFARVRGRRDLLIFRAQLQSTPKFELEVFDPRAWTAHHLEREVRKKHWSRVELPAAQALLAYASGEADVSTAKRLMDSAVRAGGKLVRLSVHRSVPNLEIHWWLPDPAKYPARDLFLKVRQISEEVLHG